MPAILPRERWSKPQLSLCPSLGSERIRIPHEYCWRGAEDSDFSPWLLLHIRTPVSVSCSTQCPGTPIWRDECGNVHYQAGLSTASTEVGSLLLWSAAMEGTVGRRGCKLGVAIGGELRAMLNMDFRELCRGEVRSSPGPKSQDFSGSCTVASRNHLIHSGATTATKSGRFDPKGVQHGLLSRAWRCVDEPFATANFGEFVFHALR
jgi:hypothetical protein